MYSLDPVQIVLIFVFILVLNGMVYAAYWLVSIRSRHSSERAAEGGELLQLAASGEQQIAKEYNKCLSDLQEMALVVQDQKFFTSEAERREEELRGVIRGICGERDEWRRLYYDQATGHDNAQIWLERDLNRLGQLFQAVTGQPAPSPLPATTAARAAFLAAHGEAIEEWRNRKSKPDKPLVPENSTPAED